MTELGRRIADAAQETDARVEAFLRVPLYERIFENYKGFSLPGAGALEKFIRDVGVSSKQTGRARQAFMRSAKQAGFFAHGEDRLVRPSPSGPGTKPIEGVKEYGQKNGKVGGSGGGANPPDPIIQGLLARLPKSGDVWPEADRKLWLELLEGSFKLIYKDKPAGRLPDYDDPQFIERRTAETKRRAELKDEGETAN